MINDGTCTLLLASEGAVIRHGLRPLARVLGAAVAGVEPHLMGLGPLPATRKLLDKLQRSLSQFDSIELNEAFSAQSLAVLRNWGLPDDAEHVDPQGGAIALEYPLGMTGARLAGTAAHYLARTGDASRCAQCASGWVRALRWRSSRYVSRHRIDVGTGRWPRTRRRERA